MNGAWLNAGTALLDRHGRIIESNEELALWAGAPDSSLLIDVLCRKNPEWRGAVLGLLAENATFASKVLSDGNRSAWYTLELATTATLGFSDSASVCRL